MKKTTYQNMWDAAKLLLKREMHVLGKGDLK